MTDRTAIDQELLPGARNAVRVCLNIQPHERVTLITDEACAEIADALIHEIDGVGAPYECFVLERVAPRPLAGLPAVIADDMERSQVSIFAARAHEPVTRQELVEDLGGGIAEAQERAVDVQITRLRRKIEEDPKAPRYLQTVRGSGYMLAPD